MIFEIFASSSKLFRVVHFGGRCQLRRYFTFAMARWIFAHLQHWNFADFNLYTVPGKNPIPPKSIQPIFEIFTWASKMLRVGIWVKSCRCAGFYFCNGKVKILRIENIWILPLSTCSMCQQKSYISKSIQPNFEIFASARRCWGCAFGWKVLLARVVYSCNGNDENLGHRQTFEFLPLSICSLCQQKSHISKGIQYDIRNLCLSSKMLRVGIWVESFRCAGILLLQWQGENFAHRQHLKFCRFQPVQCTLCQRKSYISNGIQPIFEIFASARRCWGWAFGWKVLSAQGFYLCNARWKLCASTTFEILPFSTLYTVPEKILYLQKCSTDFQNFCLSSKMLMVSIWVESFRCAGSLLLQWQGENFAHRQHLKFCRFQPVHCASKNPISPKVFNRFSKSLPQLEDVESGHLGGKFQVRRYFTFAIARRKLCASTTFEILPLSTFTLCQQKCHTPPKVFNRFSKSFASARRCWGWAFGWKVSGAKVFYFCNGKVKSLRHRQHLKFCRFQPVHCASKNPISPKVFNRFSKSLPELEDVEGGHLGGKFQVRRYFTFAMARWKLCASTTFEILPLSTCTLCQQKSHISKSIQPIFEIFASARRCWGRAFGWKVSGARVFYFCNGKVKTLGIEQHLKFWPLSTCSLCQQKSHISKSIQPIFEIFASARRCWGWAFGWKVSGARVFYFCNGKAKTLGIENIWNFATFNLYTVPAKILYLQWYSTDFRNLRLSLEDVEGGHLGGNVSGAQVFYFCNGKVKTLRIDNIWNFADFNLYTVPAKILYLQKYSTDFRNLCLSSKMLRVGIWVESFRCAGILLLQWQGENFAHRQHLKFCHFQLVHCGSKNPISPKVFNRFSKSLPRARRCWGVVHLGGKFQVRRYFTFAIARRKLCASTTFEILPHSTCTLWQQKSYTTKSIQPIFEIFAWARRCWGWAFGWKVSGADVFYFLQW